MKIEYTPIGISDVDILDGCEDVRTGWLPDPAGSVQGRLADGRYKESS